MNEFDKKVRKLSKGIEQNARLLTALGDESRQELILAMMKHKDCSGIRAVDLADMTRLSRPAVSHHLQIMKDAGIVKSRKEGTMVFYYFDPDMKSLKSLIATLGLAVDITQSLPERG